MTLTNKAYEEFLSHSNPKAIVAMFSVLFPPIPPGPFVFSQAELASLLNTAASLPHSHSSLQQPSRMPKDSGGYGWHKGLHGLFVSTYMLRRGNSRNIYSELVITDFIINHRAAPGMLLCRSCHPGNLPEALSEFFQDSTKLLAKEHPNLKCSQKKLNLP